MNILNSLFGGEEKQSVNPWNSILGSLGSGLTAGFTGAITDEIFGKDPVHEAGRMMNSMYPGTTPMERLSGGTSSISGAGASSAASQKLLNSQINNLNRQSDLKAREIQNTKEVADETNQAMIAGKWMDNMTLRGLGFSANPFAFKTGLGAGIPKYLENKFTDGTKPADTPEQVFNHNEWADASEADTNSKKRQKDRIDKMKKNHTYEEVRLPRGGSSGSW